MDDVTHQFRPGEFVTDEVSDEADPMMVLYLDGPVSDHTVNGEPLAEYGPNAEIVDDPEREPTVRVVFTSFLDANVSRWKMLSVSGEELRDFVRMYCDEWGIPLLGSAYLYPESRLERADDPR